MTQNQIRYLEALEAQRSNMAREQETNRANLEKERLNREQLEYDKYGKDFIGQAIRTGSAVGDTIVSAGSKIGEALATPIRLITHTEAPTEHDNQMWKRWTNKFNNMDNKMLAAYANEVAYGKKQWEDPKERVIFIQRIKDVFSPTIANDIIRRI